MENAYIPRDSHEEALATAVVSQQVAKWLAISAEYTGYVTYEGNGVWSFDMQSKFCMSSAMHPDYTIKWRLIPKQRTADGRVEFRGHWSVAVATDNIVATEGTQDSFLIVVHDG